MSAASPLSSKAETVAAGGGDGPGAHARAQIAALSGQIEKLDKELRQRASGDDTTKRLMTIPGVGAITATALTTFAPPCETFAKGATSPPGSASRRASTRAAARSGSARPRRWASATSAAC